MGMLILRRCDGTELVLLEEVCDGIVPGDVLVRDDYLAIKTWSRDDLMDALHDKGYKGTEDQIDIVSDALNPDALSDCTDSDWETIYDVIWTVGDLLKESEQEGGDEDDSDD